MGGRGAATGVRHILVPAGTLIDGARIRLSDEEAHHLEVRRTDQHDTVHALDGEGGLGFGHVESEQGHWYFVVELAAMDMKPPVTMLAVAAGDRDRFLWVAEKAAEIGVTHLVPLVTTHTRSVATRLRESAIDKVRRRAREACKQAGNPWFPVVLDLVTLDGLAEAGHLVSWYLADHGGVPHPGIGAQNPVGWLIGPEAGFTDAELDDIERHFSAVRISLGRHLLRFETAAISAAVVTEHNRASAAQARRH